MSESDRTEPTFEPLLAALQEFQRWNPTIAPTAFEESRRNYWDLVISRATLLQRNPADVDEYVRRVALEQELAKSEAWEQSVLWEREKRLRESPPRNGVADALAEEIRDDSDLDFGDSLHRWSPNAARRWPAATAEGDAVQAVAETQDQRAVFRAEAAEKGVRFREVLRGLAERGGTFAFRSWLAGETPASACKASRRVVVAKVERRLEDLGVAVERLARAREHLKKAGLDERHQALLSVEAALASLHDEAEAVEQALQALREVA